MSDFNLPGLTSNYTDVLSELKGRDVHAITLCSSDPTNIPTGAIKWVRASSKLQEYNGASWEDKVLSIAGGGTGSSTASAARTALGLGSIATQDNNNVNITGGSIGTSVNIDASRLSSGTVAQARLGSGSGGAGTKFLADDQTYKTPSSIPTGTVAMWLTGSAPSGWLLLQGGNVNRTTYADLFALWGTTFGVGDGSTTFGIPDFRQKFPLGKAASGTGSAALGTTGGAIDHDHTVDIPRNNWGYTAAGDFGSGSNGRLMTKIDNPDSDGNFTNDYYASGDKTLTTHTSNPPYIIVNYIVKT